MDETPAAITSFKPGPCRAEALSLRHSRPVGNHIEFVHRNRSGVGGLLDHLQELKSLLRRLKNLKRAHAQLERIELAAQVVTGVFQVVHRYRWLSIGC